jgi:hypothetical protein
MYPTTHHQTPLSTSSSWLDIEPPDEDEDE